MKLCLWCGIKLDGFNYSGDEDGYQFCDSCVRNLEAIEEAGGMLHSWEKLEKLLVTRRAKRS